MRPWPALAAHRAPQSVSEQLVLLGWLFLRPARPNNPAHFLLPPELRHAAIHRLELPQGAFERRVPLPPRAYDAVHRSLANGCLVVHLRKAVSSR